LVLVSALVLEVLLLLPVLILLVVRVQTMQVMMLPLEQVHRVATEPELVVQAVLSVKE
jgi:hypothetical protein